MTGSNNDQNNWMLLQLSYAYVKNTEEKSKNVFFCRKNYSNAKFCLFKDDL